MIQGVVTHKLRLIPDERGRLMEILRIDEPHYLPVAQIYMTTNYPGVVKAWHFHKKQSDQMTYVKGMVKVVLYDAYIDLHPWNWLHLRGGKFNLGIGLERFQCMANLTFVELGLPQGLVPIRDVGALLWGEVGDGSLIYGFGVVNAVTGATDPVFVNPHYADDGGWITGITISRAPARFISSRTMRSTFCRTRRPIGSQLYSPAASRRIKPARSINWWLINSASAVISLRVLMGYCESLIG